MGKPIEIKLDADTGGAEKGIGRVADSLGDVEDALDKVERPAKDAADALEDVGDAGKTGARDAVRGLDDVADAAKTTAREGGDLDRDLTKALENVKTQAEDSARGMKDAFEKNEITPEDIFKENLKAELVSNMAESGAEVARGFKDGFDAEDMETVLDGVTDTIVSVGTLAGPLGAAGGVAVATAFQTIAGPMIASAEEKAAQFEATFTAAFDNIVAEGEELGRSLTIGDATNEIAHNTEKMTAATETANAIGVQRGVVLRAMAGDTDALNLVTAAAAPSQEKLKDALEGVRESMGGTAAEQEKARAALEGLNLEVLAADGYLASVTESYNTNTDALNAGAEAASAKAEADNFAAEMAIANKSAMAVSTGAAQELEVAIDGVTRKFQLMPDGKVVEVTDDGSAERTQGEIDAISGGVVTITGTTDQGQFQGAVDAAARRIVPPIIPVRLSNGADWTPGTRRPV